MKKYQIVLPAIVLLLFACATAGQKYINIGISGDIEPTRAGLVGISDLLDSRTGMMEGQVGYRILLDNSQETYFVNGMDLSQSLTKTLSQYLQKKGYTTEKIDSWKHSPEGVSKHSKNYARIVGGTINTFQCKANKKGGHTTMTLNIDLTLYIGDPLKETLKTVPVAYTLEKTEFIFSEKKLEAFINESLAEIFAKALIL